MSVRPEFRHRLRGVLRDPVAVILLVLAAVSLVSRAWLLVAHRFR